MMPMIKGRETGVSPLQKSALSQKEAALESCHFFAGIGGWPLALCQAGWPQDRPIWTGSAPCPPLSQAGKRGGLADERHLWPSWHWLISQCRPRTIFGEQVSTKAALPWWDLVASDLEGEDYACAAVDLPAASVGAPHLRQRLFWVANTDRPGRQWSGQTQPARWIDPAVPSGTESPCRMAHAGDLRFDGRRSGKEGGWEGESGRLCPTGYWADAHWLPCIDGKARPIKPGIEPLVNGVPSRVGSSRDPGVSGEEKATSEAKSMRLKGYGNAIVVPLAAEFIRAYSDLAFSREVAS